MSSIRRELAALERARKDPEQPLLNRALDHTHAPGATFELVVAAAALESGRIGSVDERTSSPATFVIPGTHTRVANPASSASCEDASLRQALVNSCNTVFAKLAVDLGRDEITAMARRFGFNTESRIPVPVVKSVVPPSMTEPETALSGLGESQVRATPLQLAMVTSALANGGELVAPHLDARVTDSHGEVVQRADSRTLSRVSSHTAAELRAAMASVVLNLPGERIRINGVTMGGQPAVVPDEDTRGKVKGWFTGYGTAGGRRVAVAVTITRPRDGAALDDAAQIAKKIMEAALR